MVQVVETAMRKAKDGREFYVLILQGGLSIVQSRQSGNYYATLKRCSNPSTFDEDTAKKMISEKIAGGHAGVIITLSRGLLNLKCRI